MSHINNTEKGALKESVEEEKRRLIMDLRYEFGYALNGNAYFTSEGVEELVYEDIKENFEHRVLKIIQQAKEERDTEWKKAINSSALYHLEYDKASAFASDVLLILNTK